MQKGPQCADHSISNNDDVDATAMCRGKGIYAETTKNTEKIHVVSVWWVMRSIGAQSMLGDGARV